MATKRQEFKPGDEVFVRRSRTSNWQKATVIANTTGRAWSSSRSQPYVRVSEPGWNDKTVEHEYPNTRTFVLSIEEGQPGFDRQEEGKEARRRANEEADAHIAQAMTSPMAKHVDEIARLLRSYRRDSAAYVVEYLEEHFTEKQEETN